MWNADHVMLFLHLQFMDRLKLLLMPAKHQPDLIYLRHVPLRKVHLFTFIQILCLALLWILKSTVAAIVFPVMVRGFSVNRNIKLLSRSDYCGYTPLISK